MNIEITQPSETSIKASVALGMKSILLASSDLAQGARPWARSVGLIGQIIENNLLIEVAESANELALTKSKVVV